MWSRLYFSGDPLFKVVSSLVSLAVPKNISSFWSFGSMLGLCLVTQILTGLFLAMHFVADVSLSFDSAVHISRDVNSGWLIRAIHANGASMFFVCLYIHVGRGLYFKSFNKLHTWMVGVTLLFLTILTAFMGYVLPWGQMSYWAATVITNLLSAIPYFGSDLVVWIWGGYSVSNPTLTRFYAFHFVFPFIIAFLSLIHLVYLHEGGSNNPLGLNSGSESMKFMPYFGVKDLLGFLFLWLVLGVVVLFYPNILVDPENFIPANALVTPVHIQPEWYFLPMYAILRSIPNKMGGVIALVFSIAILYFFPFSGVKGYHMAYMWTFRLIFWLVVSSFFVLMFIGSKPVEYPYELVGQVFTFIYFFLMLWLIMMP